jgi:hypothetical protein
LHDAQMLDRLNAQTQTQQYLKDPRRFEHAHCPNPGSKFIIVE